MKRFIFPLICFLSSCTNIDCPLDNVVVLTCGFYQAENEKPLTVNASLSVTSGNGEHMLINSERDFSSIVFPLKNGVENDTLLFHFENGQQQYAVDTLFLNYTDQPHFESVDCPTALFHTLKGVRWTSHTLAKFPLTFDQVEIVRPIVNYDDVENIKIYLRSTVE